MILTIQELLAVYHHSIKFSDQRHCDMRDLIIQIFHETLRDHMFKWSCKVMGKTPHDKSPPCQDCKTM